jgi:multidrug efflux pump subunit AcrA (membrane-fusion protein)
MFKGLRTAMILGICLAGTSALMGCGVKDKTEDRAVPTLVTPVTEEIKTSTVYFGSIEKKANTTGIVTAVVKADMSFKNKGGSLWKLNVREGDMVKKGQVIAELDTSDLKYDVKQQEIRVKQAQLSYDDSVNNNFSEITKQKLALALESEKLALSKIQENLKAAVLTALYRNTVSTMTQLSSRLQRSFAALIPTGTISRRNRLGSWPSPRVCEILAPTITMC